MAHLGVGDATRTNRENVGSEGVENATTFFKQMMKRMDIIKLS
jgi:hypothetical protein